MAKKYQPYTYRIAKAKSEAEKKKLMNEAIALYGRSYLEEYNDLMTRAEKRRAQENTTPRI